MLLFQFIIVQIVIFSLVIYMLRKLMLGSTESAVNRLNKSYEEVTRKKEELVYKIQQAEEEYQKKREEAESIVNKMKEEAEREIGAKKEEVVKKAREESERMISDAVKAKEKIREEILKEEKLKLVDYCSDLMERILKEQFRDILDVFLIEDFLKELRDVPGEHLPPGTTEVEIVTQKPLDEAKKKEIGQIIAEKFSDKLALKEVQDPKILGGIIVKFGSLVLDGSLASKIKESNVSYKEQIDHELQ